MSQPEAFRSLGVFMVAWSGLETVIEVAIKKELGVSDQVGEITTSSLGFMPKLSILTSLLQLQSPRHDESIKLLAEITGNAKRNMIVHGRVFMSPTGDFTFVKSSVSKSYGAKRVIFSPKELFDHAAKLNSGANMLQESMGITEDEMNSFVQIGYSKSAQK